MTSIPTEISLEECLCPMGCSVNDIHVLTGYDHLHNLPGEYVVVRCQGCGLMRTNPRPSAVTIGYYYPDDYGPYQLTQVSPAGTNDLTRRLRVFFDFLFRTNAQALPNLPVGSVLEVGCASGNFLHKMAGLGWQVQGIEFSESAASAARALGYPVTTGQVETVADFDEPFELVVGWMVIEHFHHPVKALQKLYDWTKPGGWLAISVPNAGSTEFRLFKNNWYALHLPAHLSHFTPETIERMLNKAGWTVEKVLHQRILSNLILSFNYWVNERFPGSYFSKLMEWIAKKQRFFNLALYPLSFVLSFFGQTGRMTIWARKPE